MRSTAHLITIFTWTDTRAPCHVSDASRVNGVCDFVVVALQAIGLVCRVAATLGWLVLQFAQGWSLKSVDVVVACS